MHIGNQEEHFTGLSILFKVVLQPQPTNYDDNLSDVIYGKYRKSDLLWRIDLVFRIIGECCTFLRKP